MNLNIVGQYKYIVKEREKLKKLIDRIDQKLVVFEQYTKHVQDVAKSREEIKKGKLIPQEKLFRELGF